MMLPLPQFADAVSSYTPTASMFRDCMFSAFAQRQCAYTKPQSAVQVPLIFSSAAGAGISLEKILAGFRGFVLPDKNRDSPATTGVGDRSRNRRRKIEEASERQPHPCNEGKDWPPASCLCLCGETF